MKITTASLTTILLSTSCFLSGAAQAGIVKESAPLDSLKMDRTLLLENKTELPSNRVKAKVMRVNFPPAYKTAEHTHEGPGPRYVAKGKLKVTEAGKTTTYAAGEVFWETGQLMTVENVGTGSAELIIFELAPSSE